jgi:hypothetical protein
MGREGMRNPISKELLVDGFYGTSFFASLYFYVIGTIAVLAVISAIRFPLVVFPIASVLYLLAFIPRLSGGAMTWKEFAGETIAAVSVNALVIALAWWGIRVVERSIMETTVLAVALNHLLDVVFTSAIRRAQRRKADQQSNRDD